MTTITGEISGSLTHLEDGSSYLIAGSGISIVSQSNGSILISKVDDQNITLQEKTIVSASGGTRYELSSGSLTSEGYAVLTGSADFRQLIQFDLKENDYPFSVIDSSSNEYVFTQGANVESNIRTVFNGQSYDLQSVEQGSFAYSYTKNFGAIDVNPEKEYYMSLTGSVVQALSASTSFASELGFSVGTMGPILSQSNDINVLNFTSTGAHNDPAEMYLLASSSLLSDIFSCVSGTYSEWSVFCVAKLDSTAQTEQAIFALHESDFDPQILLYATPTKFRFAVYTQNIGINNSFDIANVDMNFHLFEISANGEGKLNVWLDGTQVVFDANDVTPQSVDTLLIGSAYITSVPKEQFKGVNQRLILFKKNLTEIERSTVRSYLMNLYDQV